MRDNTPLKNDFFLITGSSAWRLKRSAERMPGRRGDALELDKVLLPVNFREYIEVLGDIHHPLPPAMSLHDILQLDTDDETGMKLTATSLKYTFERYLSSGGFLTVVEKMLADEDVQALVDIFWEIIIGDIERAGLERSIFIRLIRHFGKMTGSRFSFTSIAQEMEIDIKTVQRYIHTLGYNFLGTLLPFFDITRKDIKDKKAKKYYFIDPFIYEVLNRKTGIQLDISLLVESLVLKELLPFATGVEEGLCDLLDFGYWHSNKGKEVDFVVQGIPIECKYRNVVKDADKSSILKNFSEGIILSKNDIDFSGRVKTLPVQLFAALCKR